MAEITGAFHFLALVGLTGALIERRIANWPQWAAPLAMVLYLALTILYAGGVSIGYRVL